MRFPFFKTQKTDTKEPINTVSATPAAAGNKLGATQRIPVGVLSSPRLGKPVPTPVVVSKAPAAPAIQGPTVSLKIMSLAAQIPTQVFSPQGQATITSAKVNIPVHAILPQLASGKISVKLGELLSYFPANILRSPMPPFPDQQAIILPLEEVIPAIPHEMLNVIHESVISADDPELGKLPTLIDDESLAAHRRTRNNSALAETQPVRRLPDDLKHESKPEPTPEPKAEVKAELPKQTLPIAAPPRNGSGHAESIAISIRGLIGILPDQVFSGTRAEILAKTNAPHPIFVPSETIIPQLRTGVVKMPVAAIVSLLPYELLASPMPNLDGQTASLPLSEIIPQLPPNLFTDHMREPAQETATADLDIPDPFQEKKVLEEQAATAAAAPVEEIKLDSEVLEDESFAIFTEKQPARLPISSKATVPIERPVPMPPASVAPEPVAEIKPSAPVVPEPVAEVKPVEPVIETPAPIVAESVIEAAPIEPVVEQPEAVVISEASVTPEPIALVEPEPIAEIKVVEPVATPALHATPELVAEIKPIEAVTPVVMPAAEEPAVHATTDAAYADGDMADGDEPETLPAVTHTEATSEGLAVTDEKKFLIDLNRCTVEDLMAIPGIGRGLAGRIIEFREARGGFTSVEELRQVPGIGRKTYRALAGVQPRALNRLLGAPHDGELSLQEIVRYAGKLPGIQGCMLALSDGLFLTGNLPDHLDQDTISVFAPQLFKKVGRYARELKVGSIRRFTIFTDAQPISIFKAGEVYLIIVHDAQRYSKALLRRCERISHEIARLSSQRVTV